MNDESLYKFVGSRVKALRKTNKITQTELSKQLNISPTALVNYENANRKIPLDVLIRIAAFFKVSLDSIVMVHFSTFSNVKHWNDAFPDIVFSPDEINELVNYGKYILYKRNDD